MTCFMTLHSIGCLCNKVEVLTLALGQLDAAGRSSSATVVVLRMKLAALTTELIAADLIERARRKSTARAPARWVGTHHRDRSRHCGSDGDHGLVDGSARACGD